MLLIGAGGLGREIAAALTQTGLKEKFTLRGFIDDNYAPGDVVNGIPIMGGLNWLSQQENLSLFIAIGNSTVREKLARQFENHNFPRIIHPAAGFHDDFFVKLGNGSYLAAGCVLTTNILIGRFTLILPGCTLSHDTTIGDFCTLMPGSTSAQAPSSPKTPPSPPTPPFPPVPSSCKRKVFKLHPAL